jgi:hypothetical protein
MKGRISPRRRKMLLLATLPLAAGLTFLAQPNASAAGPCGSMPTQVGPVSTTVTVVTYCDNTIDCGGIPGIDFGTTIGDGDPVGVKPYVCLRAP